MKHSLLLGAALALPAAANPAWPAPAAASFDPIAFFNGRSDGRGQLKVLFKSAVPVRVQSLGRVSPGGSLTLDQRVEEGAKLPRMRRWLLRKVGPDHFTGTLSDAVGPVEVTAGRYGATIRYTMSGGLNVEQSLTPRPGGRIVDNHMVVKKFGLTVATLNEVITKR